MYETKAVLTALATGNWPCPCGYIALKHITAKRSSGEDPSIPTPRNSDVWDNVYIWIRNRFSVLHSHVLDTHINHSKTSPNINLTPGWWRQYQGPNSPRGGAAVARRPAARTGVKVRYYVVATTRPLYLHSSWTKALLKVGCDVDTGPPPFPWIRPCIRTPGFWQ